MTLAARKPLRSKQLKPCKAPSCDKLFEPRNSIQPTCHDAKCILEYQRHKEGKKLLAEQRKQEKVARADLRKRKERLKSKGDHMREAQAAFNRFVRVRDYGKPCISSGRPLAWGDSTVGGKIDAGHYRSRGAAPHLRFNLFNCHAQSKQENRDRSGNATDYRLGLIDRIGLFRVERLEQDHSTRKFNVFYLKRVKSIFTRRARLYEKLRGLG